MNNYKKTGRELDSDIAGLTVICPYCRSDLEYTNNNATCVSCEKTFTIKNGILCFGTHDKFYEGKFTKTREDWSFEQHAGIKGLFTSLYRSISISAFENRFFSKTLGKIIPKNDALILDFGCGGGAEFLPKYGQVTGVDLSISSLSEAFKIYNEVYQIDGMHLPFQEASFDVVYTSHVFGHIPLDQKSDVIKEIFRILKPGGYLISSIECDSKSLVYERAKKFPDLFSKCYVEEWGHYGLELPTENFKRFRKAGFLPIIEKADIHKGYLRPVTSYINLVAYKNKDAVLYKLGAISNWVGKNRLLTRIADFSFGLLLPISYLFTPADHRDSAKIVYSKP
jgi:SAM-dependent methyltransferase